MSMARKERLGRKGKEFEAYVLSIFLCSYGESIAFISEATFSA